MIEAVADVAIRRLASPTWSRGGSREKAFYDLFDDKQDCFLAAYDGLGEAVRRRLVGISEAQTRRGAERMRTATAALLGCSQARPSSRFAIVEILAAGRRRSFAATPLCVGSPSSSTSAAVSHRSNSPE